jgi:MoxR-like ATPase
MGECVAVVVTELAEYVKSLLVQVSGTWKHAALLGLVDACFEDPTRTVVPMPELAERVTRLYWPQAKPLSEGAEPPRQTHAGSQIEILPTIRQLAAGLAGRWRDYEAAAREEPQRMQQLLKLAELKLAQEPLARLERGENDLFEVDWSPDVSASEYWASSRMVQLRDGVAERLAAAAPELRGTIMHAWTQYVARISDIAEGELQRFLFPGAPETSTAATQRAWIIRAGRTGQYERIALESGVALIGWSDLGELAIDVSRDELKARVSEAWPDASPPSVASQAGQIYRFIHEVAQGDLAVLPLRSNPGHVAVGRITGAYQYRIEGAFAGADANYTREVDWLEDSVPYDRFDSDLREAFGQQGTVSEIIKPQAAQRILAVLRGEDASAIHLVLKWSPSFNGDTVTRHQRVAEEHGAVWWGRLGKPGTAGLGQRPLTSLKEQVNSGSTTYVYLHSSASTWRTRLLGITLDEVNIDPALVPTYYDPDAHHSLWVKLTDFEQVEPAELTEQYVLANSGDPVTQGGLANQGPLIIRKLSATSASRFFILNQAATGGPYDDREGAQYHWTDHSSGAWKQLSNSPGARFVYYRPGDAADGTSRTYFGSGVVARIQPESRDDGRQHFVADIDDYRPFPTPVPWDQGPARNAQTSIQPITRAQFEKLQALGSGGERPDFSQDTIRASAEEAGLTLDAAIYDQLFAALESGKHVVLTGPPGTAKTTLAQAVAKAAAEAGRCKGYVPTTATADWTTFDTIGGLRPTEEGPLEFTEGHFLSAIRSEKWLVIDELNRSIFDRAFGQLFTVLSGQPVVLQFSRPGTDGKPLTLVPEGESPPIDDADILPIARQWRIIATMNVFDKSLLFDMSFALMRRFAFIEVASPSPSVFEGLIDREAGHEPRAAQLAKDLLPLRNLKDLGPAVFMDLTRFLSTRLGTHAADDGQLMFEAFYSYLLPQFEGVTPAEGDALFAAVSKLVGPPRKERLRKTLNSVLGLELAAAAPSEGDPLQETDDDGSEAGGS